jgi:LysM repeat protein
MLAGVVLASALLIGACSIPDPRGGDDPATPTSESVAAAATPTGATPLKIVTPTPFVAGATTTAGQTPTIPEETPDIYVVQENDTLYGIAVRFDVELDALISLNGLSDPNDIWIGQELRIPK